MARTIPPITRHYLNFEITANDGKKPEDPIDLRAFIILRN